MYNNNRRGNSNRGDNNSRGNNQNGRKSRGYDNNRNEGGRSFSRNSNNSRSGRNNSRRGRNDEEFENGHRPNSTSQGQRSVRGGQYFKDTRGYGHRKYWTHEDRRQKKIEKEYDEFDGLIRLNKYLANSGMCSRREADELIRTGQVSVNGVTVTEMGVKVNTTDVVEFNDRKIIPEKKRYLLLNKPKDYITTLRDPNARNTVMDLIEGACKERIVPVGRLDRNTTGVLLFTNDGNLARKLTHPSNEIQKIYHVTLDKPVLETDLEKILKGFELEDGFINADEIAYPDPNDRKQVGIRIHSGRNRIVRRIFEALGYDVKKLDRTMFAGLDKRGLQRGQYRFLTDKEVGFLEMLNNKANNLNLDDND